MRGSAHTSARGASTAPRPCSMTSVRTAAGTSCRARSVRARRSSATPRARPACTRRTRASRSTSAPPRTGACRRQSASADASHIWQSSGVGRVSSGVDGLDEVLYGGFLAGRVYLVRGGPGVGKTALGLHFLSAGVRAGETAVFLSHGSTEDAIRVDAASLGIDTDGITFIDFSPDPEFFKDARSYDVFPAADVERDEFTRTLVNEFESVQPTRVFLDSLTQVRHLSEDVIDFRRQAHAFLRYLSSTGATVLFASGSSDRTADEDLQFMSDGVINLEYDVDLGRSISVNKLRGSAFRIGEHSSKVDDRGMHVFPRLIPERFGDDRAGVGAIGSGIAELDALLGGGIERGLVTLITG